MKKTSSKKTTQSLLDDLKKYADAFTLDFHSGPGTGNSFVEDDECEEEIEFYSDVTAAASYPNHVVTEIAAMIKGGKLMRFNVEAFDDASGCAPCEAIPTSLEELMERGDPRFI